ncbi:MAG: amino acid ABC transporter substrate-binding protein [Acidimicrobiia bacterium]|nr:amino acid ABC transporter substrate-binding protein [Acidimicrobiia bacterium]
MNTPRFRWPAVMLALVLVLAACTGDDDDGAAETTITSGAAAATTAAPDAAAATTAAPDAAATTTAAPAPAPSGGSVLDTVIANDVVRCGTRGDLPGFAVLTPEGDHEGFDSDFCRAIAAAVLGDATKVEHVDVETADRFTALQSGQIDVLVRNATWTASRDGAEAATFLQPNFYDGQGMMVAADSGFASVADMDGVIVCVATGTTTEGNASAEAARLGLDWEVRPFDDVALIQEAFIAGQCDGWSSDVSQLTGLRSVYPDGPETLTILPEVFSKEPLAPAVRDGDSQWAQVVNWVILATIQAEEFGITAANVDEMLTSEDPRILAFLGEAVEGEEGAAVLDAGLGLPADFAYQIVSQVGNYGEIFERHLAPLGLERGINDLWINGGLMYAPPYR